MFFGLKPKYRAGMLVKVQKDDKEFFLLIQGRRFIKSRGRKKRGWVYDGIQVVGDASGNISYRTTTTGLPENRIREPLPFHKI